MDETVGFADLPKLLAYVIATGAKNMFLAPGGGLSVARTALTLGIGLLAFGYFRQRRSRSIRLTALRRALFPAKLFGASGRADVLMLLFNMYLMTMLFGWAFLSQHVIANWTITSLSDWFGPTSPTTFSALTCGALLTLAVYLAYEFGYWLDHYLSHKIPFLWEFHKVHHAAEVLTPLTNFRVHPVDTIVFYNIVALTTGLTDGVIKYLFGAGIQQFSILNANAILLTGSLLVQQLQHSHFWIPFTGIWGKIFLSPAHHQIHHSLNPIHYDKNMGSMLSVFDWLFGTLHIPAKQREKLTFGIDDATAVTHSAEGLFVRPFIDAFAGLWRKARPGAAVCQVASAGEQPLHSS
jgi:sterol desaturase/sphingolipid hydroxylase (fatty acid hydroxylase superfamily)